MILKNIRVGQYFTFEKVHLEKLQLEESQTPFQMKDIHNIPYEEYVVEDKNGRIIEISSGNMEVLLVKGKPPM